MTLTSDKMRVSARARMWAIKQEDETTAILLMDNRDPAVDEDYHPVITKDVSLRAGDKIRFTCDFTNASNETIEVFDAPEACGTSITYVAE